MDVSALAVQDAEESLRVVLSVLDDVPGPARDIVVLNAGAAIYVADLVGSLEEGIERAREVIASGAARRRLEELRRFSQEVGEHV